MTDLDGTKTLVSLVRNRYLVFVGGTDSPESVEKLNNNFKLALASQDRGHLLSLAAKPKAKA